MKLQNGFALVTCLLFLALLTLVSISALEIALLEIKMSGNMALTQRYFQATESALRMAEIAVLRDQFDYCFYKDAKSPNYFAMQSFSWWHEHACQVVVNDMKLFYIVEELLRNDCVLVKQRLLSPEWGAVYYRLTARASMAGEEAPILQSIFVKSYGSACRKIDYIVNEGRVSWRVSTNNGALL